MKLEGKKYWKAVGVMFLDAMALPLEAVQELWRICKHSRRMPWGHTRRELGTWISHNTIDSVMLLVIVFIGMPLALFFEFRTRLSLKQGKMYVVAGRKIIIPFEGTNLFTANEDDVPIHDPTWTDPEPQDDEFWDRDHLPKTTTLKDDTLIMLVKDPDEGMFGLEKKWLFLLPQGRLAELNWKDHRILFCGMMPTEKLRKKKKN